MKHVTAPRVVAALTLVLVAGVMHRNIDHFPWSRSYDATSTQFYAYVLGHRHHLPSATESDTWHNPPLFFALAELVETTGKALKIDDAHAVQDIALLSVVATILLTGLIARELFPRSRWLPVFALVLAATTPLLVRAGVLFHPEPLATALTTGGLYVGVRALARGTFTWKVGVLTGVLLGLANLTRTWAFAALGAVLIGFGLAWLQRRDRDSLTMLVAATVSAAIFVVPWLVTKTIMHGSPFAYSKPVPTQWLQHGRPLAFWLPASPIAVVEQPYNTRFQNRLLPVVYADWWGDYWRTYRIPDDFHNDPATLPAEYARPLQRQAAVGWIMWLGAIGGLVALTVRAVRRRDLALATTLLSLGLLIVSFVGFLVQYPKADGDNMKALYVLDAVPVVAIASAYAFGRIAARGTAWLVAVAVLLAIVIVPTIDFLILPG
jgi:4-amino-4-deoxy-L-arabinose transferase-like glycosyltransferase